MANKAILIIVDLDFTPYPVSMGSPPNQYTAMQTHWGEIKKLIEAGCASEGFTCTERDVKAPEVDYQFGLMLELEEQP